MAHNLRIKSEWIADAIQHNHPLKKNSYTIYINIYDYNINSSFCNYSFTFYLLTLLYLNGLIVVVGVAAAAQFLTLLFLGNRSSVNLSTKHLWKMVAFWDLSGQHQRQQEEAQPFSFSLSFCPSYCLNTSCFLSVHCCCCPTHHTLNSQHVGPPIHRRKFPCVQCEIDFIY
jgi:hypothetical protein